MKKLDDDLEYGRDRYREDQSQRTGDRRADDQHEQHHKWIEVDETPDHEGNDERILKLAQRKIDESHHRAEGGVRPVERSSGLKQCYGDGDGASGPGPDQRDELEKTSSDGD